MTEKQILDLLSELSLEEKAFQLSQVPASYFIKDALITGTEVTTGLTDRELALTGSSLFVFGPKETRDIQERCMAAHPHHIPMLFMMDVIHGYRTVFPTPLAFGATFDPASAEEMMRISAAEGSASGVDVAFSPMLDLVRDPRWGRVMESTGEDPYLNSEMGSAMVKGLQGEQGTGEKPVTEQLQKKIPAGHVSSCIKHFAAYGAPEGGREYQNVELSEHTLREYYLPSYHAAVEAGADMVMSSFQTINGIPSTASRHLLKDILRGEWGFDGVIITDWAAISELVHHGLCSDLKEAALRAFEAGVDIDMCSMAYYRYLPELVQEGKIPEADLDQAVLRVLRLKNKLGLFENPFKDASVEDAERLILCDAHRSAARKAVRESLVLLKNEDPAPLLPLKEGSRIALIGPYVESRELHSTWAISGKAEDAVSVRQAAEELAEYSFTYAAGCRMMMREDLLEQSRDRSIAGLRQSAGYAEAAADAAGTAGVGGSACAADAAGSAGVAGSAGAAGAAGSAGAADAAGSTGVAGSAGAAGSAGVVDAAGSTGVAGSAGAAGSADVADAAGQALALQSEAVKNAAEADCAVLFLGEHRTLSGEASSRTDISLPQEQLTLLRETAKVNRNIVTVIFSGRPLDLREVCRLSRTVVMAWLPGTEGGHGIMDVLTGKDNFSGKLPMSIPISVGQVPVYYNQLNTGRPKDPVRDDPLFCSAYIDTPNRPLFPFAYGLSYSRFTFSPVELSAETVSGSFDPEDRETVLLTAGTEVQNVSDRKGVVTVQLYLRDDKASLARPVRELKGFRRVELGAGEKREVSFDVTPAMLAFTGAEGKAVIEPGSFTVWIGDDSDTVNQNCFVID